MFSLRSLALIAPLALATAGNAQTILLRFNPAVGTTKSYVMTMSMKMEMPGMPASMGGGTTTTTPMTMRAVSRKGKLTTMETKTGKVSVAMAANSPMAAMKSQMEQMSSNKTTTAVIDELGNVSSASGGSSAMAQMGAQMMQGAQGIAYPAKALKVGDSWTGVLDMGKMMSAASKGSGRSAMMGMTMTGKIPIVYKLTGLEKRGTKTFAKLSVTMIGNASMSMGAATGGKPNLIKMHSVGTTVVDTATGLLDSMTTTSDTNTEMMGQTMKQHMVMTMKTK